MKVVCSHNNYSITKLTLIICFRPLIMLYATGDKAGLKIFIQKSACSEENTASISSAFHVYDK